MDYSALAVVQNLPDYMHPPSEDESVFRRLSGARIIKFGTPAESTCEARIEGGGLVVDYELDGEEQRIVFAFNELGMWVEYDSVSSSDKSHRSPVAEPEEDL